MTDLNDSEEITNKIVAPVVSDALSRFQALKAKRQEAKKLNKREIFQDAKNQRMASIKARQEEINKQNQEAGDDRHTKQDEKDQSEKNLEYTIEETEKWQAKQKKKNNNHRDGTQNLDILAETTYIKEISDIKIDKEEYNRQKKSLMEKYNVDDESQLKSIVDVENKPSPQTMSEMVTKLAESNERKMKRKRNKGDEKDVDSFINEKNKQFNMKLNRQYN